MNLFTDHLTLMIIAAILSLPAGLFVAFQVSLPRSRFLAMSAGDRRGGRRLRHLVGCRGDRNLYRRADLFPWLPLRLLRRCDHRRVLADAARRDHRRERRLFAGTIGSLYLAAPVSPRVPARRRSAT